MKPNSGFKGGGTRTDTRSQRRHAKGPHRTAESRALTELRRLAKQTAEAELTSIKSTPPEDGDPTSRVFGPKDHPSINNENPWHWCPHHRKWCMHTAAKCKFGKEKKERHEIDSDGYFQANDSSNEES